MSNRISMTDLHDKLTSLGPKDLVLDVRTPEEFQEGHVPGSRNIPHDEIEFRAQELKAFDKIYLHCRSGKRAQVATQVLEAMGFKNITCVPSTGMMDWEAAGYEISRKP